MTYDALKPLFDRDGFIVVRPFLTSAELAELQHQLDRYIREVVPGLPPSAAFYLDRSKPDTLKQLQHMRTDPWFADYARHPKWVELASVLVGEPVNALEPEWFNKPPASGSPTPPHQDNYYFNLTPSNVVTLWLALDDVDDENGCLRYVRGSHHHGVRPHNRSNVLGFSQGISNYGEADEMEEVAIHLNPGDVVAHHGNTIHRAEPNRSPNRHRRAFAIVFQGETCRRDEAAFARYQAAVQQQHAALGMKG